MKQVLLIQGTIMHYRVPVFNELAKRVNLTVLYSYGELPEGIKFDVIQVPTFELYLKFHKRSVYQLAKNFDVLIVMFDLSYVSFRMLPILPRKYKVIYWGIGVAASYNIRYDESNPKWDEVMKKYINYSDATVFYSSYPVEKYRNMGIKTEKLFVANNTVEAINNTITEKSNIIFVGSLYKQKKIHELLENYYLAYKEMPSISKLIIIGEGEEYQVIEKWISNKGLTKKIEMVGAIYDEKELSTYFASALICISPDQAGLTVLKSMGYGVPFVTMYNAITGGEIFNIKNNENGILIESFSELKNIIIETTTNKEKFEIMGEKAKDFYNKNRTVTMMVDGFEQAIKYVSNLEE